MEDPKEFCKTLFPSFASTMHSPHLTQVRGRTIYRACTGQQAPTDRRPSANFWPTADRLPTITTLQYRTGDLLQIQTAVIDNVNIIIVVNGDCLCFESIYE